MRKVEQVSNTSLPQREQWSWPLDLSRYDRTPLLTFLEREALVPFTWPRRDRAAIVATANAQGKLARLMQPLCDAFAAMEGEEHLKIYSTHLLLRMCAREDRPFWAWEHATWVRVLGTSQADFFNTHQPGNPTDLRQYVIAAAYQLDCFSDFQALGGIEVAVLAYKVFGRTLTEAALAPILEVNAQWGYSRRDNDAAFRSVTFETSPRPRKERLSMRLDLLRTGRWLSRHHPEVNTPADFTRELAAELVAAVNQMCIGDFSCENLNVPLKNPGQPWSATRKHSFLGVLRRCFSEAIDWGWMERRFNPQRVFATPRHLKHQMRVAPRIIENDIWAKLLWAGLNLRVEDCPLLGHYRTRRWANKTDRKIPAPSELESFYPLELLRALAIVWLFAGLRSDELSRLRVGCARMQTVVTGDENASGKPVCLLDIPVHKTGRAFTKPVDPLVGEAIAAWETVRPAQPDLIDPKTGERVQFLFCYRAKRISQASLNKALIPTLCQRAGVPLMDARGSISSHRARSTIASQLFNAREPMTLFELQAWLGHQSPATTQHYVSTSPTKLAQAYKDAGYFSRNVRAIEVLIDQNAITSGAAANGSAWRYYDLGHGWCSYEFFDQCPHRMACARCDFYIPKESDRGLWLQTRDGLLKLLQEIPLNDEERAAVDGDVQALSRLLERLSEVPTPSECQRRELPMTPVRSIFPGRRLVARSEKEEC